MGMFDNVAVNDRLPVNQEMIDAGLDINNHSFQTKDLHRCLTTYYLQGGRLFEEKFKIEEWVEEKSRFSGGYMRREEPYLVDMQYHGVLNFYDFRTVGDWDYWVEYNATFTHGAVEKIDLVNFRKTSNIEKNARLKEILEQAEAKTNKWYNRFLFNTSPWRKVRNVVFLVLTWIECKCQWARIHLP